MKKVWLIFTIVSLSSLHLFAGSVRLLNDSSFKLRAVIRGSDGSYLGEMVLPPQTVNTWSDSLQHYGGYDQATGSQRNASRSQTPYTVIWYCMDGSDYSISDNIGTGAMTQAQQGSGKKSCGAARGKDIFQENHEENLAPSVDTSKGPSSW
jgi:hypothetical protein